MCYFCEDLKDDFSSKHMEEEFKKLNEDDIKEMVEFAKYMVNSLSKMNNKSKEIEEDLDRWKQHQYIMARFI